jgi:hypothetical protein
VAYGAAYEFFLSISTFDEASQMAINRVYWLRHETASSSCHHRFSEQAL